MKRSAVITKLISFIHRSGLIADASLSDESRARLILDYVEHLGLNPPGVRSRTLKGDDYKWGGACSMRCICEDCDPEYIVYRWEKE